MPKWVNNTNNQVATWIKEKQQLEVDLAKKLVDIFNKPALIDPLRTICELAAFEMAAQDEQVKKAVAGAIKEETTAQNQFVLKNAEFQKAVAGQPNKLEESTKTFTAPDCSNVIRLYGAFIEQYSKVLRGDKDALRVDFKNRNRWRDEKQMEKFSQLLTSKKGSSPVMKELITKYETGGMSEFYSVQNDLIRMEGGQKSFRLEFDSRILKLDTWFGLVSASDISGTTTDTLYFLNKMANVATQSDPIYRMLPLGTIVAGAHHSMIEVALPLSQNKFNDYAIGKYTSLMVNTSHPSKGEIVAALQAAENDKRNRLFCVGYTGEFKQILEIEKAKAEAAKLDPNDAEARKKALQLKNDKYDAFVKTIKVDGAYEFESGEKAPFFAMANAAKLHPLLDKEHAWPTHNNVKMFLQKNGFPKAE